MLEASSTPETATNGHRPALDAGAVQQAAKRYHDAMQELAGAFIQRDEMVAMMGVTVLAAGNMIVFGPPGNAKSAVIRRFAQHVKRPDGRGLRYFYKLLGATTVPSELFGAVDMKALKDESIQRNNIAGMAPDAHIIYLDEVYKSISAVLNPTLTIMNERTFGYGPVEIRTPTLAVFGSSNERPKDPSLAAFDDRWDFRTFQGYLDEAGIDELVDRDDLENAPPPKHTLTLEDVLLLQRAAREMVRFGDVAKAGLKRLWRDLHQKGIIVSDRRFANTKRLLRAHALYHGRFEVTLEDFPILIDALWQDNPEEQRREIGGILLKIENPQGEEARQAFDDVVSAFNAYLQSKQAVSQGSAVMNELFSTVEKINQGRAALDDFRYDAEKYGYSTAKIDGYIERVEGLQKQLAVDVANIATFNAAARRRRP